MEALRGSDSGHTPRPFAMQIETNDRHVTRAQNGTHGCSHTNIHVCAHYVLNIVAPLERTECGESSLQVVGDKHIVVEDGRRWLETFEVRRIDYW